MTFYPVTRNDPINSDKLAEELEAAVPDTDGFTGTLPNLLVVATRELTAQEIALIESVVANHNPATQTENQVRLAALAAFLDSRMDDLKYGDYFYRLQKKLLDPWHPPRPNLTDRIAVVITALKGNKDTDANHADMWNTFLDMVQVEYGATVAAGEIVFSGTVAQQAAQARDVIRCARACCDTGVIMMNMLIANLRGT
jgi:hypothetical protein